MALANALCLFTARVEARDGEYVVTVPEQEIDLEPLERGGTYRVGVYPSPSTPSGATRGDARESRPADGGSASDASRAGTAPVSSGVPSPSGDSSPDQPPVAEGETLRLEIEDVGDQGDGLARVGPGYVVFVPDTEVGQQPLVRVTTVRENFAFAEVLGR